jgi:hypothetical protein
MCILRNLRKVDTGIRVDSATSGSGLIYQWERGLWAEGGETERRKEE